MGVMNNLAHDRLDAAAKVIAAGADLANRILCFMDGIALVDDALDPQIDHVLHPLTGRVGGNDE
jgi:hypothetical protein